ncbi:MAG: methyl-accepting chemotaxis protein [Candidatus Scalindua sp.]
MKANKYKSGGNTGLARMGVNKLLILGFGVPIVATIVVGMVAWISLTGIAVNVGDITENAQLVNDGMVEVASNTRQASDETEVMVNEAGIMVNDAKAMVKNVEEKVLSNVKTTSEGISLIGDALGNIMEKIANSTRVATKASDHMVKMVDSLWGIDDSSEEIKNNLIRTIIPAAESNMLDMVTIEKALVGIVDSFTELTEKKGTDVNIFITETKDLLKSIKGETLPLVRSVKDNARTGAEQIKSVADSLSDFSSDLSFFTQNTEDEQKSMIRMKNNMVETMNEIEQKFLPLVNEAKANTQAGKVQMLAMVKTLEALSLKLVGFNSQLKEFGSGFGLFVKKSEEASRASKAIKEQALGASGNAKSTKTMMLVIIVSIVLALIVLSVVIRNAISKPIKTAVESLDSASHEVTSASIQISGSSQSLAQGASEQATSLEETSASMEEMASVTKQNVNNAEEAARLVNMCSDAAENGNRIVREMNSSMEDINASSKKIGEITKVIDSIAFQTNLLALNAAVEAARAGEHGKGFAVVAEEVRNLAQRSATAAKDTTVLTEDSVRKAENGVELAVKCGNALQDIVKNVKKAKELTNDIMNASSEQSEGIGQVRNAVQQMDQITQQNAASAEETASASEELSAQAQNLKEQVEMLSSHVGIKEKKSLHGSRSNAQLPEPSNVKGNGNGTTEPELLIPLNENRILEHS